MKTPEVPIIAVPITIRAGKVEFFYGGPLPGLKEGKIGNLEIPADAFENPKDVELLSVSETVKVLEKGATLHAHISHKDGVEPPKGLTSLNDVSGFWGYGSFAPIVLNESLRMTFPGTKKPFFEPCECSLPTLKKTANSVNEAYTKLSEIYEPHRRAHTGNVFEKVVFLPKGERFWLPLENLREQHQLIFEAAHFQSKDGLFAPKKTPTETARFVPGRKYSRREISDRIGGSEVEYLPTKDGRVVCGCFTLEHNPEAPDVIIPGTGIVIEREAKLFCEQDFPVPVFLKRRPNEWEYVGHYKAERFSTESADIAAHHKGSITPLNEVTRVIFLTRSTQ